MSGLFAHSHYDLAIAGGGPAGCAAAITAARRDLRVLLLEQGRFPRHKVCGEFVSPEGAALLQELLGGEAPPLLASAPHVARARLFLDGQKIETAVAPPAASISRFALDDALWRAAAGAGTECHQQTGVRQFSGAGPFSLQTAAGDITADALVIAAGRWSNLRHAAARFDPWVGLKAHFFEDTPSPSVDLYFFADGYCGVQPVGDGLINACAMVRPTVARSIEHVFALDPALQQRSRGWRRAIEAVSTFPLVFSDPVPERGGVLYAGDAAGFIDPFVGDGISIALRSGAMAAECVASAACAAKAYRGRYAAEILPLYRNASLLRRLLSLPRVVRRPVVSLLEAAPVARFLVRKTRHA